MQSPKTLFVLFASIVILAVIIIGCGGGNTTTSGLQMGTVQASVSDPATCGSSGSGEFQHVYITVTDVKINQSATAGANDSGWVDLAPGMAPKQIDLLGNPSNQCFLAQLGAQSIQAGTYEQIRIMLLANSSASQITGTNNCASVNAANCVVLGTNSVKALQLSSEAQTGIKIPAGQIAGGAFTVAAGSNVDLNIDFDACASIVIQGNGQYRLKPVLHAGEVSLQTAVISGKVVDSVSGLAIGGPTLVALEQRDASTTVDRVVMETMTDAQGNFEFCPVPTGMFDVVAVGVSSTNVAYAATVITGVQAGNSLGNLPLVAQPAPGTAPASITGVVSSAGTSGGIAVDVALSATQPLTIGGNATLVTIPLVQQSAATAQVSTASGASCPAGTFCATYTLSVPAANPNVGAFGTTPTQDTTNPVNYTVDALAFQSGVTTPTLDCTPSDVQVNTLASSGPLQVTAGNSFAAANSTFTGCQ